MENLIQSLFLLSKGLAFTYSMQNFKADSFTLYLHFSAKSTLFVIFTASTVKLKHKYEIEIVKHILRPITHMWVIFQLPPADKMSITHMWVIFQLSPADKMSITHMWVIFQLPPADKMSITH